jgi:hypothetical protein
MGRNARGARNDLLSDQLNETSGLLQPLRFNYELFVVNFFYSQKKCLQ